MRRANSLPKIRKKSVGFQNFTAWRTRLKPNFFLDHKTHNGCSIVAYDRLKIVKDSSLFGGLYRISAARPLWRPPISTSRNSFH
jgi:hypothetical protein